MITFGKSQPGFPGIYTIRTVAQAVLVLAVMLLAGCGKTAELESVVKNGHWKNNKTTIGNAFELYPYFTGKKWKTLLKDPSEGGRPMVKFTALVDYSKVSDEELAESIVASKSMRNANGGLRLPGQPLEAGQPEPVATAGEIGGIRNSMKGVEVVINFAVQEGSFELHNIQFCAIKSNGQRDMEVTMSDYHEQTMLAALMRNQLPPMTTTVLLEATATDRK